MVRFENNVTAEEIKIPIMQWMLQKEKPVLQCFHQERWREAYDETGRESLSSGV